MGLRSKLISLLSFIKLFSQTILLPDKRKRRRAKLIINPLAGEGHPKKTLRMIQKALKKSDILSADVFFSRSPEDASRCAQEAVEEKCDLVIVAGGDGTINKVIQGLALSMVPLGIIPLGTANVFAEEMGIPKDIDKAVEVIAKGRVQRVDLGKTGERYFLWLAGVGADALVAQKTHGEAEESKGLFSYFLLGLKHCLKEGFYTKVKLNIDGQEKSFPRAIVTMIGNATTYDGCSFQVKSSESMDDGYLDVVVVQKITPLAVLRGIFFFFIGRRTYYRDIGYADVKYFRGKKIVVDSFPQALVHTDGEVVGETPKEFNIVPKALSLILPQK